MAGQSTVGDFVVQRDSCSALNVQRDKNVIFATFFGT